MSGNTSATGGFLPPLAPSPVEDQQLTNLMQETIVGMTGLSPTLVRPRWQETPPTTPPAGTNWCAVGSISRQPLDYPSFVMQPDDSYKMFRNEEIEWLISYYGPDSDALAGVTRDGLYVPQNWELLNSFGVRLLEARETTLVPELVNKQYIGRTDLPFSVMRQITRIYPVLPLLSATGTVMAWVDGTYNTPEGHGITNQAPLGTFVLGTNTLAYYTAEITATFDTTS